MKCPKILYRVPLPLVRNEKIWLKWCVEVSDELIDCFSILQRSTVFSDAICSSVMASIYRIPAKTFGKVIDEVTIYDVLYGAVDLQGFATCLNLYNLSQKFPYKLNLMEQFKTALQSREITATDWLKAIGAPLLPVTYWLEIGLPVPIEYERVIKEWLCLMSPWPLGAEEVDYLIYVFKISHSTEEEEKENE